MEGFNPRPMQCAKCLDVIKSDYPGQYKTCKCGAIAVDQTKHYSRYLGNPEDFIDYHSREQDSDSL